MLIERHCVFVEMGATDFVDLFNCASTFLLRSVQSDLLFFSVHYFKEKVLSTNRVYCISYNHSNLLLFSVHLKKVLCTNHAYCISSNH